MGRSLEEIRRAARGSASPQQQGPGGLLGLLPKPAQDVLTFDLARPLRQALDPVIPDLELRAEAEQQNIQRQVDNLSPLERIRLEEQGGVKAAARANISAKVASGEIEPDYFTGFIASSLSSVPELFGRTPSLEGEVFRIQNPWMGLASQLVAPIPIYGAAYKAGTTGRLGKVTDWLTEGTLKWLGKTPEVNKIAATVARTNFAITPLELTRLGVGYTVYPENLDNVMGNVLLDYTLGTVLGAGAGKLAEYGKRVAQKVGSFTVGGKAKDIGMLPTFELRLMKDPNAQFVDVDDPSRLIQEKANEVLSAVPGKSKQGSNLPAFKGEQYFYDLGDVNDDATAILKKMFSPGAAKADKDALEKSGMQVMFARQGKPSEAHKVNKGVMDGVLKTLGLADETDLAAAVVYPRVAKLTNDRIAGQLAKTLEDGGSGLQWFADDGVMLARDNEGLWVFAKRVGRTEGKAAAPVEVPAGQTPTQTAKSAKEFGRLGFRNGDYFLLGKTDRLDLILPKHHQGFDKNMKAWAKMNAYYRPGLLDDEFNRVMDVMLDSMNHQDWMALKASTRASGVARISSRLKGKVAAELGIADSNGLKVLAENIYDVVVPTARKAVSSPTYGKLQGLLKFTMERADELGLQIMRGIPRQISSPIAAIRSSRNIQYGKLWDDLEPVNDLVNKLTLNEVQLIREASTVPGEKINDALAALSDNGLISDTAQDVVRQLQETNKRMLEQYIRPALKNAGVEEDINWLEGYLMPKIFKGDAFVDVKAGNRIQYRVTGANRAEAQRVANAIVEEAKVKGWKWTADQPKVFEEIRAGDVDDVNLQVLFGDQTVGNADKDVAQVVMAGIRRARTDKPAPLKVGRPGTLTNERGKLKTVSDFSHEDMINAIGGHNRQLLRYAANRAYYHRWNPELQSWGELGNEVMMRDIQRKMTQYAGIEGTFTRAQNDALRQITGSKKPMTRLAATANELLYQMNLGIFNTTFAVLNVLTPLMTTAPWISFMTRAPSYKQLQYMQVLPRMGADGKPVGAVGSLYPMKVLGQALKMAAKPTEADKKLIDRAIGDGVLNAQLYENFVGGPESAVGQSLREAFFSGGAWQFLKTVATAPALKSEQLSRLIAFNSAVRLGADFFGLADEALYRFAKKGTEQTMYGYGLVDRPRVMTGPLGSVIGLFKNWQFHYINQMVEYAGLATRDGVFGPLAFMGASTLAVGGIGATPLRMALDGLANAYTESPTAFHWLQNNWGNSMNVNDAIYFGLPAFLGFTLQSSAMMPGTDINQDLTNLYNFVSLSKGMQLGQAVGNMVEYSNNTSQSPFADDNLSAQFLGAVLPRSMARLYAVTESDGITSMRSGYSTVKDVSATTKLLYGLGLNQVDVEKYQVAGRELYKDEARQRSLIQTFGMEYAEAMDNGRTDRMQRVIDKSMMLSVPLESVMKSALTRGRREEGDALSRYSQAKVAGYNLEADEK